MASEPGTSEPALSPEKQEKAQIKLKYVQCIATTVDAGVETSQDLHKGI